MDKYKCCGGPVGRVSRVYENRAAVYPLPTALLGRFAPCVAPWGRGLSA